MNADRDLAEMVANALMVSMDICVSVEGDLMDIVARITLMTVNLGRAKMKEDVEMESTNFIANVELVS